MKTEIPRTNLMTPPPQKARRAQSLLRARVAAPLLALAVAPGAYFAATPRRIAAPIVSRPPVAVASPPTFTPRGAPVARVPVRPTAPIRVVGGPAFPVQDRMLTTVPQPESSQNALTSPYSPAATSMLLPAMPGQSPIASRRCLPGANGNISTLCDLISVKSLMALAAAANGERSSAIGDEAWSGSDVQRTVIEGDGVPVASVAPPVIDPAQNTGSPIVGAEPAPVQDPAAVAAAPWQGDLDAASALMNAAGKLISAASLLVFAGKLLLHTFWGAAAGAAMIASGMVMAGVAAGLAAAATVLGALILLKYDQKLQGSVVTLSAAALTVSAILAMNGDRGAYGAAEQEIGAIDKAGVMVAGGWTQTLSTGLQSYFSAIQAGMSFTPLASTSVGAIINGGFGLESGISGLMNGGGFMAGYQTAMGATGVVTTIVPVKGEAGQILNAALSASQIATSMWPTGSSSSPDAGAQPSDTSQGVTGDPVQSGAPQGTDPSQIVANDPSLAPASVPQTADPSPTVSNDPSAAAPDVPATDPVQVVPNDPLPAPAADPQSADPSQAVAAAPTPAPAADPQAADPSFGATPPQAPDVLASAEVLGPGGDPAAAPPSSSPDAPPVAQAAAPVAPPVLPSDALPPVLPTDVLPPVPVSASVAPAEPESPSEAAVPTTPSEAAVPTTPSEAAPPMAPSDAGPSAPPSDVLPPAPVLTPEAPQADPAAGQSAPNSDAIIAQQAAAQGLDPALALAVAHGDAPPIEAPVAVTSLPELAPEVTPPPAAPADLPPPAAPADLLPPAPPLATGVVLPPPEIPDEPLAVLPTLSVDAVPPPPAALFNDPRPTPAPAPDVAAPPPPEIPLDVLPAAPILALEPEVVPPPPAVLFNDSRPTPVPAPDVVVPPAPEMPLDVLPALPMLTLDVAPPPAPVQAPSPDAVDSIVVQQAVQQGLDPALALAVVHGEMAPPVMPDQGSSPPYLIFQNPDPNPLLVDNVLQDALNPLGLFPTQPPADPLLPAPDPASPTDAPAPAPVGNPSGPDGSLSAKYESGGRGSAAIGYDSTGGYSYGTYQIATKNGTMSGFFDSLDPELLQPLQDAGGLAGALSGSPAFKAAWVALSSDPDFVQAQADFIESTHYDPQAAKIQTATGLDLSQHSLALQNVVWSVSVQNGGNTNLIVNALSGMDVSTMSDADIINAIYAQREATKVNGAGATVLKYFSNSTPAVQKSVLTRFQNENAAALAALNHG